MLLEILLFLGVGNIIVGFISGLFGGLFDSKIVRQQTEWVTEVIGLQTVN